jgi:alginate O-acetyltransferase complex protein AlgI
MHMSFNMELSPSLLNPLFLGLLLILGLVRQVWPSRLYVQFGALASAALIGLSSLSSLLAIAGTTLLFVYPLHRLFRLAERRSWPQIYSRSILLVALVGLVGLLVFFKVYRHFSLPWLGGSFIQQDVAALIGFSYFIFRAIGFLHIQSILPINEKAPWTLLFFHLFPPTLSSGPIQKFQDFSQQVQNPLPLSAELLSTATYRITRGFFRKLVVAFVLDGVISRFLNVSHPTVTISVLTIALLYFFFYYDFAGYSDIAIGFGLLIGIKVPENFRQPFAATTASEFWRNWHITLADWFRDQVFIPLGGMQGSRFHAALLAFGIMLLCGLWHGVTFAFVAWGIWHGSILFAEAIAGLKPIPPALRFGPRYWCRVTMTNALVAFGAIFFLDYETLIRLLRGFVTFG